MYPTRLSACVIVLFVISVGVRSQNMDGLNVVDGNGSTYDYRPRRRPDALTRWLNYRARPLPRPDDRTRRTDYVYRFYGENNTRATDVLSIMQIIAELDHLFGSGFSREWRTTDRPAIGPIDSTRYDFSELASNCLPGFEYVNLARSCYKVVYDKLNWTSADQSCRAFDREAHLVAIMKSDENSALKTFLRQELAKNLHINASKDNSTGKSKKLLWTSGRQMSEASCTEPFVWQVTKNIKPNLSFTHWRPKEPNCLRNKEHCIHLLPTKGFLWNDISCGEMLWPLCEYDPM